MHVRTNNVTAQIKAFRVKKRIAKIIRKRKTNIAKRISRDNYPAHEGPVLKTPNIYDPLRRERQRDVLSGSRPHA